MQITITGPRGCGKTVTRRRLRRVTGKTTVALEIAKFVRDRGCEVRLKGDGQQQNKFLRDEMSQPPDPESMTLPMPITILDSFEPADEHQIRTLAKNDG